MTPATLELLLSPAGQDALAAAAELRPTEPTYLRAVSALRKRFDPALATAATDTAILRAKARAKFRHADRMYFTREMLEMASGEAVAAYRAERFRPFGVVADLGCGLGADTLALAADGRTVIAIDRDPLAARLTELNAAACGVAERVQVRVADVAEEPLPDVQAVFADPGRRADGQRFLSLSHYLPPPGLIVKALPPGVPGAFKLAPGLNRDEVTSFGGELEFISANGELKEAVLWLGDLRTAGRRATLLEGRPHPPAPSPSRRGGVQGDDALAQPKSDTALQTPTNPLRDGEGGTRSVPGEVSFTRHSYAADTLIRPDVPHAIGAYLFDPAAAVVRAELEGNLAAELNLHPTDDGLAVFTADAAVSSPFFTRYAVEAVLPLDVKRVNAHLTAHGIGRVTVVQCGSGVEIAGLERKLKGKGDHHRFLVLTRELGRAVAVVAERLESGM